MAILLDHVPIGVAPGPAHTLSLIAIPDTASTLRIRLARCTTLRANTWPDATTLTSVRLFVLSNGSSSFGDNGGFASQGGIHRRQSGDEAVESTFRCPLSAGIGRQLQVTISVEGPPVLSALTVEVE